MSSEYHRRSKQVASKRKKRIRRMKHHNCTPHCHPPNAKGYRTRSHRTKHKGNFRRMVLDNDTVEDSSP